MRVVRPDQVSEAQQALEVVRLLDELLATMSVRSWPGYDDDEEDCSASLRSQSPARSLMEGRRRVLDDMASDLSWSDLASDIMSESGTASSHQLIALHQLVQGRLVSEPALRARVVSKLCADGEVQLVSHAVEGEELGHLVAQQL